LTDVAKRSLVRGSSGPSLSEAASVWWRCRVEVIAPAVDDHVVVVPAQRREVVRIVVAIDRPGSTG
jgi:hypothetical protein